jgi:hypothetical protein
MGVSDVPRPERDRVDGRTGARTLLTASLQRADGDFVVRG